MKIDYSSTFLKAYKKRISQNPRLKKKFVRKVKLFAEDPFLPLLDSHKLTGKLKGSWAFKVDNDCRVVFEFIEDDHVMFTDVGKHDQVYF